MSLYVVYLFDMQLHVVSAMFKLSSARQAQCSCEQFIPTILLSIPVLRSAIKQIQIVMWPVVDTHLWLAA